MYIVITLVLWLPQDVQMIINLILGCVKTKGYRIGICFFSTKKKEQKLVGFGVKIMCHEWIKMSTCKLFFWTFLIVSDQSDSYNEFLYSFR